MLLFLTVTRCIFLSVPLLYHSMGQIIIFQISCMLCVSLSHFQPIFTKFGKNLSLRSEKEQEGWLSPTERAPVSAISLMHNLATSGESRRYVVAFTHFAGKGIWLPQESLRHILASPGYALGQSR